MLLGQNFGRRHKRHLLSAFDRLQRRQRGNHGLARADIPLQQPLHRCGALQVVRNLADHALLRACQLEARAFAQLRSEHTGAGQHGRTMLGTGTATDLERQLLRQQFVELETRPCRMGARIQRALGEIGQSGRRRMQKTHRVAEFPQVPSRDH